MTAGGRGPEIPDDELQLTYSRSSGPGGQHANKAATKVTLRWSVVESATIPDDLRARFLATYAGRLTADGTLILSCQESRSRHANVDSCRRRLAAMIDSVAARPKPRRRTKPSRTSRQRRLDSKKRRGETKRTRRRPSFDD